MSPAQQTVDQSKSELKREDTKSFYTTEINVIKSRNLIKKEHKNATKERKNVTKSKKNLRRIAKALHNQTKTLENYKIARKTDFNLYHLQKTLRKGLQSSIIGDIFDR